MQGSLVLTSVAIALVAIGAGTAAVRPEPAQTEQTLIGVWGGDRIRLDGTTTGARVQLDCMVARTEEALTLDKTGAFAVAMTFVPIRGVQIDGPEDRLASRVTGQIENDVLHITITSEQSEANGTFTLRLNGKAKLPNCRLRS